MLGRVLTVREPAVPLLFLCKCAVPSGAGVLAEAELLVLALMAPTSFAQSSSAQLAALAAFTSAKVISFSCLFALSLILRVATAHFFSSIVFDLRSFSALTKFHPVWSRSTHLILIPTLINGRWREYPKNSLKDG